VGLVLDILVQGPGIF